MKVLVVGSGGREHALIWKLAQSPGVDEIWCAPGNAGIAAETVKGKPVQCVNISAEDLPSLRGFAERTAIDFTVVGPDNPLALGIVDFFQEKKLKIWGPNRAAAEFEASKVFSQRFMERHGIPTARSGTFEQASEAEHFADQLNGKCAVKTDGLALGKGVLICQNTREAKAAIDDLMVKQVFGPAGRKVVIQEFLEGVEVSLHALCDGQRYELFPTSQDHKRVFDHDQGPNTGGMGTYSPAPFLEGEILEQARREILDRWVAGCKAEGIQYRGIIYPGVMVTRQGPKVLEFNARFGDPETQVYMMRLESDLLEALMASTEGRMVEGRLHWTPQAAVCVVMASGGYPGSYSKGAEIGGLEEAAKLDGVKVFHAGTVLREGKVVTNGGRVLGVTARGSTLLAAQRKAYEAVRRIGFEGAQFRTDIAAKALPAAGIRPPCRVLR